MRLFRLSLIAGGLVIAATANAENSRLTPSQMDNRDLHSLLNDSAPDLSSPVADEEVNTYYGEDEPVGSGVYSTSTHASDAPVPPPIRHGHAPPLIVYPSGGHHRGLWDGYCNKCPKPLHRAYGCPRTPCCRPKCCLPEIRLPKICLPKICLPKVRLPKVRCCPKPCCKRPGILHKIVDRLRHCGHRCRSKCKVGGHHVHHYGGPAAYPTHGPYESYGPHDASGPAIHDSYDFPADEEPLEEGIEPEFSPQDSLDAPPAPPTEARRRFPFLRLNP